MSCGALTKSGRAVLARIQRGLLPPGLTSRPYDSVGRALAAHIELEPSLMNPGD